MSIKVNTIFKYILPENIYFLILYNNYVILITTLIKISFKIYDKKNNYYEYNFQLSKANIHNSYVNFTHEVFLLFYMQPHFP